MRLKNPHYSGLLLLFISSFVAYNWLFDYVVVLQYETPASFFVFSRDFLAQWLDQPGDLLLYADRFLRQFFHYEWLGALIIAASTTGLGALLYAIRAKQGHGIGIFHTFVPCLFLLILYPKSPATIGLSLAGGAFLVYLHMPGSASRQAYALLVTPALYFVAGGYSWFFVAWVTGAEWLDRPPMAGLVFKLLYPALAASAPLVAYRWLFPISLRAACLHPFDLPSTLLDRAFFTYLLLVPLWPGISWGARFGSFCRSPKGTAAQAALLLGLAVFLLRLSYDPTTAHFADYHRLYKRGQWDAILDKARRHPLPDGMSQFFANYALAQQGKLLDEMFNYPQVWGTRGLLPDLPDYAAYGRRAMYNSDLYFAMGHIAAAYKLAYNQVYIWGETYANLRRVAECTLVNGNYEIAEKYLNKLEKTLFHREFTRPYKRMLADPGAVVRHFAALRARRPTVELEIGLGDFACLLSLVKSDPRNRLAFDYLTAWCLLDKAALPLVAENVQRFAEAGYSHLPVHCQEALMMWENTIRAPVDRHGFAYDASIGARFQRFGQELKRYPGMNSAAAGLKTAFGSTYTYYYLFTQIPVDNAAWSSWLTLGNELNARGEVDEAVSYYRQALLKNPRSADAHVLLGNALTARGDAGEAAVQYRQALGIMTGSDKAGESLTRTWRMGSH